MQVIDLGAWTPYLEQELRAPYFAALLQRVGAARAAGTVYPPEERTFFALTATPPERVRAVILGQDPYHEPGQAHGLAFSVRESTKLPPSLVNIYKERESDLGIPPSTSGDLRRWAEQGVLLLNAVLTVRAHEPASHAGRGWEQFTDAVVRAIAAHRDRVVYMLWGSYAQRKGAIVDPARNCILKAVHPSPLSAYRGFFGCRHFSQANAYLEANGRTPVVW